MLCPRRAYIADNHSSGQDGDYLMPSQSGGETFWHNGTSGDRRILSDRTRVSVQEIRGDING
jgi:hypothetical protein